MYLPNTPYYLPSLIQDVSNGKMLFFLVIFFLGYVGTSFQISNTRGVRFLWGTWVRIFAAKENCGTYPAKKTGSSSILLLASTVVLVVLSTTVVLRREQRKKSCFVHLSSFKKKCTDDFKIVHYGQL